MKPKERYLNYALLSATNCEPTQNAFKEDIPIDLSTKRSPPSSHNFGLFKSFEHAPFQSPPHGNEWTAKYCFPNLLAKQYAYSPAIFPYLFINSSCLPNHEMDRKHEEPLYEPYGLPYRLPQDGLLFPFKYDPYGQQHLAHNLYRQQTDGDRAALSSESSSSSVPSSPYDHEYQHMQQMHEQNETIRRTQRSNVRHTQEYTVTPTLKGSQMFSSIKNIKRNNRSKLRKSYSHPNLTKLQSNRQNNTFDSSRNLRRTKSEQNLHLIKSSITSPSKICAPKKMFASNYYQNMKENVKECKENNNKEAFNQNHNGTPTRFYRNYRKEVIGKYLLIW